MIFGEDSYMKIIYKDGTVAECPPEEELHVLRHSAAHIMAQAIKRLYPQADFAYGPATQNGFYYDVDLGDVKLTPEDLEAIEKEMKKICKENLPFKSFVLNRQNLYRGFQRLILDSLLITFAHVLCLFDKCFAQDRKITRLNSSHD